MASQITRLPVCLPITSSIQLYKDEGGASLFLTARFSCIVANDLRNLKGTHIFDVNWVDVDLSKLLCYL
jgi:hypothetical protein